MRLAIALAVIGASLLVCSSPVHKGSHGARASPFKKSYWSCDGYYCNNCQCPDRFDEGHAYGYRDGYADGSRSGKSGPLVLYTVQAMQEVFSTMPQIRPELADILYQLDVGFIDYIISHHRDLPSLLAHMQPRTLEHVIKHVPSIGERLAKLSPENVKILVRQLDDLKSLAKRVQSMLTRIQSNDSVLHEALPNCKPEPEPRSELVGGTQTDDVLVAAKMDLKKARPILSRVDELSSMLSTERQRLLREDFPHIANAFMNLDSQDLRIPSDNVAETVDLLNNSKGLSDEE
ncbi:hypothetical protein Aperf_G00000065560 [Anoplocephala perfoliata]